MVKEEMTWDLSQLVESTDPESIQVKLKSMISDAETMRTKYHGKIADLKAEDLLELLELKDAYDLKFEGTVMYCRLMYAADSTKDIAKQLNDAAKRAQMRVRQKLAFIHLELGCLGYMLRN